MSPREQAMYTKKDKPSVKCKAASPQTSSLGKDFALKIQVRGRNDFLHEEVCSGLEDAIRIGEKWFRAFQARNPCFVQDSKQRRIFILLDPESRSLPQP